jgi:methionyl-tRNA formyltransferase
LSNVTSNREVTDFEYPQFIFFGSSDFSARLLSSICRRGFRPLFVVTRQDKPAGRGLHMHSPPVKVAADGLGITVLQPKSVNSPDFIRTIRDSGARVAIVVAFGQILSQALIDSLPLGFFNVHLSLLPELRGAAPVPWAIARGYTISGVTLFRIVRELDAGPILNAVQVPIEHNETTESLFEKLFDPSIELACDGLVTLNKDVELIPQDDTRATFAPKILPEHGSLNFTLPAWKLQMLVRAFAEYPGAYAMWHSGYSPEMSIGRKIVRLRILDVSLSLVPDTGHSAGRIIRAHPKDGLYVQAGLGVVHIECLRPEGKKTMSGLEFVRGYRPQEGDFLLPY